MGGGLCPQAALQVPGMSLPGPKDPCRVSSEIEKLQQVLAPQPAISSLVAEGYGGAGKASYHTAGGISTCFFV